MRLVGAMQEAISMDSLRLVFNLPYTMTYAEQVQALHQSQTLARIPVKRDVNVWVPVESVSFGYGSEDGSELEVA
jgi:hypothetical protein